MEFQRICPSADIDGYLHGFADADRLLIESIFKANNSMNRKIQNRLLRASLCFLP